MQYDLDSYTKLFLIKHSNRDFQNNCILEWNGGNIFLVCLVGIMKNANRRRRRRQLGYLMELGIKCCWAFAQQEQRFCQLERTKVRNSLSLISPSLLASRPSRKSATYSCGSWPTQLWKNWYNSLVLIEPDLSVSKSWNRERAACSFL